jgi:thioredoxin reductase
VTDYDAIIIGSGAGGLTAAVALAQAIQEAVTNTTMRQRAAKLGSKIQAEDGIANAVAVIQRIEGTKS